MNVLAYNLVRLVILEASRQQRLPVNRISFIDALRWLRYQNRVTQLDKLLVI
jgi:hypothetical protein